MTGAIPLEYRAGGLLRYLVVVAAGAVVTGFLREAVLGAGFAAAYLEAHLAWTLLASKTPSAPSRKRNRPAIGRSISCGSWRSTRSGAP